MLDKETPRRRRIRRIGRVGLVLVTLAAVLLAVRSSVARVYRVDGASDAPTLLVGDYVLINLAAYDLRFPFTGWQLAGWGEPDRGDMVLCRVPGHNRLFVKRVAAVGGDTIELRGNRLTINGEDAIYQNLDPGDFAEVPPTNRVGDRFAVERLGGVSHMITYDNAGAPVSDYGPYTVPGEHYFILGDNRDNSYDSRMESCGSLPRSAILGRLVGDGRPPP